MEMWLRLHGDLRVLFLPRSVPGAIAALRDTLPEEQRGAFYLQMGIGKGSCDCGTVGGSSGAGWHGRGWQGCTGIRVMGVWGSDSTDPLLTRPPRVSEGADF